MRCSSSARRTPMWAKPFIPPPPKTSATRLPALPPVCFTIVDCQAPSSRSGSRSLQVLIQSVEPNDRAADHEDVASVATNDGANQDRGTTDDHQRLILTKPGAA